MSLILYRYQNPGSFLNYCLPTSVFYLLQKCPSIPVKATQHFLPVPNVWRYHHEHRMVLERTLLAAVLTHSSSAHMLTITAKHTVDEYEGPLCIQTFMATFSWCTLHTLLATSFFSWHTHSEWLNLCIHKMLFVSTPRTAKHCYCCPTYGTASDPAPPCAPQRLTTPDTTNDVFLPTPQTLRIMWPQKLTQNVFWAVIHFRDPWMYLELLYSFDEWEPFPFSPNVSLLLGTITHIFPPQLHLGVISRLPPPHYSSGTISWLYS